MSGLFDQIVNYSPPLLTAGQVNYKGTWNAATNTPGLVNPPDALSKGDYYVVSADGTQFSITFAVGDWIISNGTAWEKVDLTDAVSSVFGRTGAVVGVSTDYSAVGITNTAIGASSPSTGAFTSLSSSSTTTLNGTTIPASKTLVVTTDKLSALAATTSAELAGVISDETGSGALVFASSPTLVTPTLGAATATSLNGVTLTGTSTPALSVSGTASVSGSNTGDQTTITGNAGTATILQTARNINGVSFNGSADITVTAAAGTLTGATLAAGVTASSLTSLGTITSLTATALTVNDNTTLGSSNSDTVVFNARVASDLNPSTDDTYDLGIVGHEWRNLRIDGTANIDSLVADTADINGGTIDGTAIGGSTAAAGAFTTVSASGVASFAAGTNLAPAISFSADANTGFFNVAADTIGITTAGVYAGNFQTNSAGGGLYIQAGGTNQNIRLVPTGTGSVVVDIGGTITSTTSNGFDVATSGVVRGSFTSTGLAVTGALSATGNGSFAGAYGSVSVTSNTGTNGADVRFINTGGTYYVGVDSSTGGAFGATAYDMIHFLPTGRGLSTVISGSGVVTRVSSTGLAVTGTLTTSSTTLHTSSVSLTNGAGSSVGTLTNAPSVGNPTKWIPIVDNGTTRYIPCW
jgi:hypothetical protein